MKKKPLEIPGAKKAFIHYEKKPNRSETGDWQTVKDTFTTLSEPTEQKMVTNEDTLVEPQKRIDMNLKVTKEPIIAEAKKISEKSQNKPESSKGNNTLFIVIAIGLFTLLMAGFMIKKANQERDSIL